MRYVIDRVPCCCRVTFSPSELSFARYLAGRIAAQKVLEGHHKIDSAKEVERWTTGLLGEIAVQNVFGIDFIDYGVGASSDYNKPDLMAAGFDVGVKTSCFPNYPVISRSVEYPELFVVLNANKTQGIIAGLASVELLKKNADSIENERYVKASSMLDRKNAFTDLDILRIVTSKEDLM